jgi:hypothetical protein
LFTVLQDRFIRRAEDASMTDLLVVVGAVAADAELIEEIARRRPDRVTVLVEDAIEDWATDESLPARALRDRLAALLRTIEDRTGATVVGLVGSREQLRGWRFDRVVQSGTPIAA